LVHVREHIKPSDLVPTVLIWALADGWIGRALLPDRRVVVQFESSGVPANRTRFRTMWLVQERSGIDICTTNPGHPVDLSSAAASPTSSPSTSVTPACATTKESACRSKARRS